MNVYFRRFLHEESGAVTVDWIVLTAVMAGFGFAVAAIITTAAQDPADGIGAVLTAQEVASY